MLAYAFLEIALLVQRSPQLALEDIDLAANVYQQSANNAVSRDVHDRRD
jgi:hypothetical protein